MRLVVFGMSMLMLAIPIAGVAADKQPQPTDPMSSSQAPDSKPTTGNSTFDAPNKPPGPWGEIPGGGGPSGYNDGAAQKSPQYEGEKYKSVQQSERDAKEKPGGKEAPQTASDVGSYTQKSALESQLSRSTKEGSPGGERHHEMVSPGHLGPQGGSTADSGKAKHDEQARSEQDSSKSSGTY